MRDASGTRYVRRTEESGAEDYMKRSDGGGQRVQLIIALLGIFSLAFMLWTIGNMLGVI